ncbi:MAG: RNA 2',3'-cyclic phosphodiesterase [Candidatus Cloacimonadaceae bacterium]|jgi:2'-5' RNA ligase|nr:RNA 2',3'-cyclic phosphodiesterase [Candidatus Cloacimonadota bacterium]MCB5257709.1 RNA 2',3'-cyclic phosphodiesterase [Candidatus Cloacimonadota bacterium]MDD5625004.1 RNA 2',3'-cyclic phosphodiesterase [Candidatus Cloacimonadota bacterium]MDY0111774.1 RNA 2',3'-cyclic phosphodiesterase [Candidatus Syntrophosphaera sp.]
MNYRTFIALEPPKTVFLNLKEKLNAFTSTQGVNWVKEQNLHLTLLFLGDVDSNRINELSVILEESAEKTSPFNLSLQGLELFPYREPRLIWATLVQQDDSLLQWHKTLLKVIRRAGFEPDIKPLKLHITLGRIKTKLPISKEREILESKVDKDFFSYDTLTLYRSILKPEGPVYQILDQFILS